MNQSSLAHPMAEAGGIRWAWLAPRAIFGLFAAYVLFRAGALIVTGHVQALWLKDYNLYMDATRRWLAGGPFYPAWQTSGPYELIWGAILYPPVMLILFVPFVYLPAWLWILLPLTVTLVVIASHRPGPWRLAVIAVLLSLDPLGLLSYPAGTPTIWFVMFMALATRWPWWSALILMKPTLLPFALVGVRSRNWWIAASVLFVASLAMWSLTITWIGLAYDQRGSGVLYSVLNVPFMLIPLVAAAKRWPLRTGSLKLADTKGSSVGLPPASL